MPRTANSAGNDLELLSPPEVSSLTKIALQTLANYRSQGIGPKYLRIHGGHVRYRPSDVREWLANCERQTGSDGRG